MKQALLIAAALLCGANQGRGGTSSPPRQRLFVRLGAAFSTATAYTVSPGTVSFSASNPNGGAVAGSSPASVTWSMPDGENAHNWTLSVSAASSSFSGCPAAIPISAVRVTCGSASVSGGGGTATCNGPFTLSTGLTQVAGGTEGAGSASYSVLLSFTLDESWRYKASNSSCTLSLTYQLVTP